jgi:hypothetical protein
MSQLTLERTVAFGRAAPVSGIVVDGSGVPVPNASIGRGRGGVWSDSINADAEGKWTVATLGAGRHAVHASSDIHIAMLDMPFETDGIHPTTGVVVRVQLGAQISGIVVDPNGKPVVGVRVRAVGGSDETKADGRFLIQGVREGEHEVRARSEIGAASDVTVTVAPGGRPRSGCVSRVHAAGPAVDGAPAGRTRVGDREARQEHTAGTRPPTTTASSTSAASSPASTRCRPCAIK